MGNEIIGATPRGTVSILPSAPFWATNGGIYLGKTVLYPSGGNRPLDGKERLKSAGPQHRIKTNWIPAGGEHRFCGDRHVLTVGPNGSGKTRKLLLPNLLQLVDWSCVVIDPKGELAAHTAVWRAARWGHKVIVVDPFRVIETNYPRLFARHGNGLKSHGFNPLGALDCESPSFVDDAKALAVALIKTEDARDPYWTMAAQTLVKGLLMSLSVEYGSKATLNHLRDILGTAPKTLANYNRMQVEQFGRKYPAIAASLSEFTSYSPDDRELSGIRRTAKTHTDWLDSGRMRADLEGAAFNFASIKERPTTIYLVLPPKQLVTHGVWLRLMVTSILLPLLRSVEAAAVPVLFMLDEFAQLGHMEVIENNYALMRGFGVKLWTVWQDLTQAKRLYKEQWESFISNAGVVHSFAPQDLTTREYLSKLSGERVNVYQTKGSSESWNSGRGSFGWSGGTSTGEQRVNEPLVKPHELAALDADEAVLFGRRGLLHFSICPQPEFLKNPLPDLEGRSVAGLLQAARGQIER
jgi:type IV secretion system protein VirD4